MNKRKSILVFTIILMSIGFAAVSTTLFLNGNTHVASNTQDFDVYFSKAIENGVENNTLIQDKTHIAFETELSKIEEEYILDYEVTNASKQYDTQVQMNCIGGNEYIRVTNEFETNEVLPARTIRPGKLTVTVIKVVTEEKEVSISCEIKGNAVERETAGSEEFTNEKPLTGVESLLEKINDKSITTYTNGNVHEMYTFEHAKTEQLDANTDYRYIGDDPYNYIKFNNEIWRIIGVFPDEEGIYRIKLIRNEPYVISSFDTTHRQEWSAGTNSWEHSDTRALMATKVNRETQEEYVEEAIYYLGGYPRISTETSNFSADEWYNIERGTKTYNSSIYPRKTNIKDKVALMYPSDFAYSYGKGVSEFCYTSNIYCRDGEEELGWMQKGLIPNGHGGWQYTITSSATDYSLLAFARVGPIISGSIQNMSFARPVVYLKPDIEFKSGGYDGSLDKPYEIK